MVRAYGPYQPSGYTPEQIWSDAPDVPHPGSPKYTTVPKMGIVGRCATTRSPVGDLGPKIGPMCPVPLVLRLCAKTSPKKGGGLG